MLALVQIDRRSAAEAIAVELEYLATEAEAERAPEVHCLATAGAVAAERWSDGIDGSRAEVARIALAILNAIR